MDDESRDLSLRLSKILEKVGVSEKMRKLRRDARIMEEILMTVAHQMVGCLHSCYTFGSAIEGTTTYGMKSDHDFVFCYAHFPVIDHIQQAPHDKDALLAVSDYNTKAGYVKLQLVCKCHRAPHNIHTSNRPYNQATFGHDNTGKICFKHPLNCVPLETETERNGPADTARSPCGSNETDIVYAARSITFPRVAVESLLECTRSGWLTRDQVEEMIQYGCFYVGVGHPSSEEKELEWRISFSLQERKLMFKLNPTEHKCYVLLKFIKNMLTSAPDIGKSITSYHCKTCLFRVINKTPRDLWVPDRLILCTLLCLTELLQCLHDNNFPNFFIRANNMFESRVYGQLKERLIHDLRSMLNEGCQLFYRIRSDNIGTMLRGVHWDSDMEAYNVKMIFEICIKVYGVGGNSILSLILNDLKHYSKEDSSRHLFQWLCYLSSVNTITEHTKSETKAAMRALEPILHRFYAANLASLAFSTDVHESKHRLLQSSARHLRHAMTTDLMSSRLLYATILYRQGNIDTCCDLLDRLERNLHEPVIATCRCHQSLNTSQFSEVVLLLSRYPDPQSMWKSSVALCTVFLTSAIEIIPTALKYELYRSVATPPGSRRKSDNWFDWAVVDSKVYIFFMQYLVYSRLNRPAERRRAIDNLLKQLLQEYNLGHRETGYNLLGWIYSQEGQTEAAASCFIQSWRIRPHHNAAKWHMLNLLSRLYVARQ